MRKRRPRNTLRAKAASLRKNPTSSERKLSAKVVIEIDGSIHDEADTKRHDKRLTTYLRENYNVEVLHFGTNEVLDEIDSVLQRIRCHL